MNLVSSSLLATAALFVAGCGGGGNAPAVTRAVATPTLSPAGGSFATAQSVTLSDATAGATIFYTVNITTPTTASTAYTGAINVSTTTTITAIAVAAGDTNSAVASATYTILPPAAATPTFTPAPGTYTLDRRR